MDAPPQVPLPLKIAPTVYTAILVPTYCAHYGPTNFLWFSDLALMGLTPALWREDKRLMSVVALTGVLPEIPWNIGYFTRLLTGKELFGLSHYMFDKRHPLWIRALSLFHVWMPPLLLWSVRRFGYDGRALPLQIAAGEAVLLASYALAKPQDNVNWVYGPGEKPQHKIPRALYLCAVMAFFPLCVWLPAHYLFKRLGRSMSTRAKSLFAHPTG